MRSLRQLSLLLFVVLAGCTLSPRADYLPATAQEPYLLDTGDVVRVSVYGEAELTNSYRVSDGGALSLPLVGNVPVRGKTTQAAAIAITAALRSGYIREPSVAVEVETYRPFYIQGGVISGGQYPYVYGMTLRAAISTAGGFSDLTAPKLATIYRRVGDQTVEAVVDMNFLIRPGDTIVVPGRRPMS